MGTLRVSPAPPRFKELEERINAHKHREQNPAERNRSANVPDHPCRANPGGATLLRGRSRDEDQSFGDFGVWIYVPQRCAISSLAARNIYSPPDIATV